MSSKPDSKKANKILAIVYVAVLSGLLAGGIWFKYGEKRAECGAYESDAGLCVSET